VIAAFFKENSKGSVFASTLSQLEEALPILLSTVTEAFEEEFDFMAECRALEQAGKVFAGQNACKVPEVYMKWSSSDVIVMDRVSGIPIAEVKANFDTLVNLWRFIFVSMKSNFYHGDPHARNVVSDLNGGLVLYDWGQNFSISQGFFSRFMKLGVAMRMGNARRVAKGFLAFQAPQDSVMVDIDDFEQLVEKAMDDYGEIGLLENSELKRLGEIIFLKATVELGLRFDPVFGHAVKSSVSTYSLFKAELSKSEYNGFMKVKAFIKVFSAFWIAFFTSPKRLK